MTDGKKIIEVEHLTRDYGGGRGVFDVSFQVAAGEVFGFLGPNGAGKTTTIRHLMGFLKAKEGGCRINGLDCFRDREKVQQMLGYLPGEISFFDDMTGVEFLDFVSGYRKDKGESRRKELMDMFDLNPHGKIKKMSKGMKQKVGIVAAFMHDPQILILDEPFNALDYKTYEDVKTIIRMLKAEGKTIFLTLHHFKDIEQLCDQVYSIEDCQLVPITEEIAAHYREMD